MSTAKPYFWERRFDPAKDRPPGAESASSGEPWYFEGTIKELATGHAPAAPLGEYIYRQTKQMQFPTPLRGVKGRLHDGWVYYVRNEKPFVQPRDPKTSYQLDHRVRMRMVQMALPQMSRDQRQDWDRFAATFPHLRDDSTRTGAVSGNRALGLYKSASLNRLAMGLPVRVEAPTAKCTVGVSDIEMVAAPQPGQMAFRLFHNGASAPGLRVLVEMSPGMKTERRVPREQELTKAAITDMGSFFCLGENGATYVLDQPRYTIAPGQRFAVRVTVLTEEGLRSRSLMRTNARGVQTLGNGRNGNDGRNGNKGMSSFFPSHASYNSHPSHPAPIYPLSPPATPLPSHQEVYRRHRALYCPDRAARPLTAEQLARRIAADQENEVQYARQMAATEEQLRLNKLAKEERWQKLKREHPELIARGLAAIPEAADSGQ